MSIESRSVNVYSPNIPAEDVAPQDETKLQRLQETATKIAELNGARLIDEKGTIFLVARETGAARFGKMRYEVDAVIKGETALIIEENVMSGKYKNQMHALDAAEKSTRVDIEKQKRKSARKAQQAMNRRAMWDGFKGK